MSVPALGIAYKVLNIVHATTAGSPAAQAELTKDGKAASSPHFVQGDKIAKAEFLKGTAVPLAGKEKVDLPEPIDFTAEKSRIGPISAIACRSFRRVSRCG